MNDQLQECQIYFHDYRYMEYERNLALREITDFLSVKNYVALSSGYKLLGSIDEKKLDKLVYFQGYNINQVYRSTLQYRLEQSSFTSKTRHKQNTRYSVHGMHEYKGKFNPQIVRGLLNLLGLLPGQTVIDPFCGSGTTLVECTHTSINAIGFDINPLAVYITNAKLKSLSVKSSDLMHVYIMAKNQFQASIRNWELLDESSDRIKYLKNWFPMSTLVELECFRTIIEREFREYQGILLTLASDLLRNYSLQEPSDLRIRRRKTPMPLIPFIEALQKKVNSFIHNLEKTQSIIGVVSNENQAYLYDSRIHDTNKKDWIFSPPFDGAITSPPYGTALPYIDTQRLSLVWLNLCPPPLLNITESKLTGSREFMNGELLHWNYLLNQNKKHLPDPIYELCVLLQNTLSSHDGFRRKAVPYLLYRYFSDMQDVFIHMFSLLKPGAPFALVVGHNHTILGGTRFDIDTPKMLAILAKNCGWKVEDEIMLQTYQRYGLNRSNAVKAETLVILRKP